MLYADALFSCCMLVLYFFVVCCMLAKVRKGLTLMYVDVLFPWQQLRVSTLLHTQCTVNNNVLTTNQGKFHILPLTFHRLTTFIPKHN